MRVLRTEHALMASMTSLLKECRFSKLTVDKICKEGLVSRAAFYSHFIDKYDLLHFWLSSFFPYRVTENITFQRTESVINKFVAEHKRVIKNLLLDSDEQTLEVVLDSLCACLQIKNSTALSGTNLKDFVSVQLYASGFLNYILWQAKNNFPAQVPLLNEHSFDAIKNLLLWSKDK